MRRLHLTDDSVSIGLPLVADAPISFHVMLYIVWGKEGLINGIYMQSFGCKKFHSEHNFLLSLMRLTSAICCAIYHR